MVGGIDVQTVIWIFLQHNLRTVRKLIGVLIHVLGGDRKQRLFVREGIGPATSVLKTGSRFGESAIPRWDGALLVARLLRAQRGQRRFELCRFLRRDLRHGM